MNYNPFNIPDLTPMYNSVRDYIKEHQGDKGFINTSNEECDGIYYIIWSGRDDECYERRAVAVKVIDTRIYVLVDFNCEYTITDDEIRDKYYEQDWYDLAYSDILYIPTIFSLADNIEQYVER